MKIFKVRKGSKVRTVYAMNAKERYHNNEFKKELQSLCLMHCDNKVVHGFMPFRSAVTNAQQHIGFNYSVSCDLKNFFDSVTKSHVTKLIKNPKIFRDCFYLGAPRQGFPTSPLIANLAAVRLDRLISRLIRAKNARYTRYADDLTISFNERSQLAEFLRIIEKVVKKCNFQLNKRKTRFYDGSNGLFRSVTGISVSLDSIHPPRHLKRKLRAAKHQNNQQTIDGLEEYMRFNAGGLE